ncbi:GerMN domain-containing protein [Herbivorax sp. ANBcel31]|uniref:GerMN domain-containing protein n=1 Tax=Herbivorax sp. ANBcel31 TaxID=3069754 RepID=UPI0027B84F59|nr:GerMN domain-containing protein [Herbivorax sp. ANBcel31]MDQ2087057.1 GerMN domain-containing protein [Herbivorax sp. ANBcel31]
MRRFTWIVVFVIILFLNGCQIPVDNVSDEEEKNDYVRTEDEIVDTYDSLYSEMEEIDDESEDDEDEEDEEDEELEANGEVAITVYYRDSDDMIVPVTRNIERQEGIARAVIESMIKNEENKKHLKSYNLFALLPEGTVVLGMNIKEDAMIVDFNERFLSYEDKTQEINIISSVVYSLTEFDTIDDVKILVGGREKDKLEYGTDISGYLNRENVLINSKKVNIEDKVNKVDVYFYKSLGEEIECLLPMSFEYIGIEEEEICGEIVRLLGKDYADKKVFSQLPSGVSLIDSKLEEDTLILNFNGEIRNYGGTSREKGILKQILYSMKQIEDIKNIRIMIEGKEGELPEGTDISRDIPIPDKINTV